MGKLILYAYAILGTGYCWYRLIHSRFLVPGQEQMRHGPGSIVVAATAFGACIVFPDKFTDNPYAIVPLRVFGFLGLFLMLCLAHFRL